MSEFINEFDAVEKVLTELDEEFQVLEVKQRRAAAAHKMLAAAYAAVNKKEQTDDEARANALALLSVQATIVTDDRRFK